MSRNNKLTQVERDWIQEQSQAGIGPEVIRDELFHKFGKKITHSTVYYWGDPEYRENAKKNARRRTRRVKPSTPTSSCKHIILDERNIADLLVGDIVSLKGGVTISYRHSLNDKVKDFLVSL